MSEDGAAMIAYDKSQFTQMGDPRIATTQASTAKQMKKLNLFCKLVQETSAQPAHDMQTERTTDL